MMDRLVICPEHGQAWIFSACAIDALLQAAALWDCEFCELLAGYRAKRVRVMIRKKQEAAERAPCAK